MRMHAVSLSASEVEMISSDNTILVRYLIPPVFRNRPYTGLLSLYLHISLDTSEHIFGPLVFVENPASCSEIEVDSTQTYFTDCRSLSVSRHRFLRVLCSGLHTDLHNAVDPRCLSAKPSFLLPKVAFASGAC